MRVSTSILALLTLSTVAGCGKDPLESCPDVGRAFIETSVRTYFDRTYPAIGGTSVNVLSDEHYDATAKMWTVSANTPEKDYFALISCDGHVELSRKKLGPSEAPKS